MRKLAAIAALTLGVLVAGFAVLPSANADPGDLDTSRPSQQSLPKVTCIDSSEPNAQPTDDLTQPATVCVHWTTTGANATTDSYASDVLSTAQGVLSTYQQAGYRSPISDEASTNNGGNGALDIYREDLDDNYYGCCATDDPSAYPDRGAGVFVGGSAPAYCMFRNDYSGYTIGRETADDVMHVTAAHEIFHSVQFAYNANADNQDGPNWLMEGTAVWAESELFPKVHDHLQYMPSSPVAEPGWSLDDDFADATCNTKKQLASAVCTMGQFHVYGDWVFFRWLTEQFPGKPDDVLPPIIRQIWEAEDSTSGQSPPDSLDAIAMALQENGTTWPQVLARFAADNLHAQQVYGEAKASGVTFPQTKPNAVVTLTAKKKSASKVFQVAHMASNTLRLTPRKVGAKKLTIDLNLARSSAAAVTVTTKKGTFSTTVVKPNSKGKASLEVAFGTRAYVDITVVDANTSMSSCGNGYGYACDGRPMYQTLTEKISAHLS